MHQLKLVLLIACIWRSIFVHIWILRLCDLTITNILYHVIFTIPLIWIWLLCLHSPCRIHLFFCMASSQENLSLHPLKCLVCQTNLLLPIVCVWRSITIHFGTLSLCVITINMVVSLYVTITIICTIPLIWILTHLIGYICLSATLLPQEILIGCWPKIVPYSFCRYTFAHALFLNWTNLQHFPTSIVKCIESPKWLINSCTNNLTITNESKWPTNRVVFGRFR